MPSMKDYWTTIFSDLARAAGREDLLGKLRTADLRDPVREEQFSKLKQLKLFPDDVVEMPKASFLTRYKSGDETFICIQVNGFADSEKSYLIDRLGQYDVFPDEIDESTFMMLTYGLPSIYRIKDIYSDYYQAIDFIEVADSENYVGHEILDLINIFDELLIFRVQADSIFASCDKWFVASFVSCSTREFRSKTFPDVLADRFFELLLLRNTNPEHIFYAVTSIHIRQCFLELYRCVESLFYLPWTKALKAELGTDHSCRSLAGLLRSTTGWRHKERDSICNLFSIAAICSSDYNIVLSLPAFNDLDAAEVKPEHIARRIYKIRNILVHQEDYDDTTHITITQECWPKLVHFLLIVTENLYRTYKLEADFDFSLK